MPTLVGKVSCETRCELCTRGFRLLETATFSKGAVYPLAAARPLKLVLSPEGREALGATPRLGAVEPVLVAGLLASGGTAATQLGPADAMLRAGDTSDLAKASSSSSASTGERKQVCGGTERSPCPDIYRSHPRLRSAWAHPTEIHLRRACKSFEEQDLSLG